MKSNEIAEFLSIWFTFPALAVSVLLLFRYGGCFPIVMRQIFKGKSRDITPAQWIAVGICICFFGSAVDNGYWLIPWGLKLAGMDYGELFNFGVFVNIPFRQAPLLIGGGLHVLAEALRHSDKEVMARRMKALFRTIFISIVIGFLIASGLTYMGLTSTAPIAQMDRAPDF